MWRGLTAVALLTLAAVPGVQAQRVVVGADSLAGLVRFRDTLNVALPPPYRLRPFVVSGSVRIVANGAVLDTNAYRLDAVRGLLWLNEKSPATIVQLIAGYETYGYRLAARYGMPGVVRREAEVDTTGILRGFETPATPRAPPDTGLTLRRSGSITRGVLAGSNRDVSIESALRLQLDGEVAPGVRVEAALTDANTPILAEGTTQRLSEFDRVYVGIETRAVTALLGDVDLVLDGGELARLHRKVQGGAVEARLAPRGAFAGGRVFVTGSAPRGLFRLQQIPVLDGVQGPYRLQGAAGEPFVLVIPGSEAVFLNGERLVRDRDADYTIDYATAEITFTSRRLVRATDRLTAEFQYTAHQFPRALVAGRAEAGFFGTAAAPRLHVGASVIQESDARGLPAALDLTAEDSLAIAGSGDDLAYRSGATLLPRYDPEAPYVQYRREARGVDTVFVALEAAPMPGEPVYRVRFTRVGPGLGSYVRGTQTISGLAYTFVGPGQGEYEPRRLLPKPRLQAMVGLQARARPVGPLEVFGEWAGSRFDENRRSSLDEADDDGGAYVAGARVAEIAAGRWGSVAAEAVRRVRGATFRAFERTRPVDFAERWNVPATRLGSLFDDLAGREREATDEAFAQWTAPRAGVRLETGRLALGPDFRSTRVALDARLDDPRLALARYRLDVARSRGEAGAGGTRARGVGEMRRPLGAFSPGVAVEHEWQARRLAPDTLDAASRAYVELRPGVRYSAPGLEGALELVGRTERAPQGGALLPSAEAVGVSVAYRAARSSAFRAEGRGTVRRTRYRDAFLGVAGRENLDAVAMQHDVRWSPLRRAADLTITYDAQTERRPTLQEVYVRISPELAEARYVWRDRDGDGARDLDEFILETTPFEGEYARTLVPTDSLAGVATVRVRARLGLDPARIVAPDATPPLRWLRGVTMRTTLEADEQSRAPDAWRLYVLDLSRFLDEALTVSGRLRAAHDVTLWPGARRGSLDLGAALIRTQTRLATGDERRRLRTLRADGHMRLVEPLRLRLVLLAEGNAAESDRFASRRYRIESRSGEAEATYSPSPLVALRAGAAVSRREDVVEDRAATVVRIPLEGRWSGRGRYVATGGLEASFVRLRGEAVGEAAYELTEGRGEGRSLLWNATLQAALTRTLNLSLTYDGRAPEAAPVLHTLRMQVSAVF
jgi:hypothetical protein